MKLLPVAMSLRTRLLLASALVQTLMLAMLIASAIQVMDAKLGERARLHLEEQKQLLYAAIAAPLARKDYQSISQVFEQVRHHDGISYLLLSDANGKVVAASGWDAAWPLPEVDRRITDPLVKAKNRFDTVLVIAAGDETYGRLWFGVSTAFIHTARAELIRDNLLIGALALIISLALMIALSYWLTRNLTQLTKASESLAGGDLP
jgi:methyl-accepting chemotaxis protein